MRRGDGPLTKKLRRTIESPGSTRGKGPATVDSDESQVWHSTAISNFSDHNSPGPFRDAGSEILGSQKSAFSDSVIAGRSLRPLNHSPVKITEPSGHVYFSSILQKHGFFLSPEGNHTQNDSMVFRKIMTEWVDKAMNGTESTRADLQMFIQDMKRYLGSKENLINAMSPTEHAQELYQASLLHSLLGVLPLQKHLFSVLFPTLAEAAYTTREEEDVAFFNLLLNQLKWLPYLDEAEKITDDFLEIFERATPKAQHELMRLLPDIVPESLHRKIGDKLQKLLEDFSPLCSSIMDCFSVINVPDSYIVKVRGTAVENMLVADQKDIPAYLGFLLGVEEPLLLATIIGDLRDKLVLRPMEANAEYKNSMDAMIEKVKFCMSVNGHLVPTWVKQVKEEFALDTADFKTLDFVMLFTFVTCDKLAEVPLKSLFLHEDRTLQVLQDVLECLPTIVDNKHVFEGILKFSEKFFWTNATKFYGVASKVLAKLFPVVTDTHAREVIKLFTCTLAHGNKMCREHVLSALTVISKSDSAKLLRFTNLIMAIMDFVLDFEPSQIRSVIRILATVAYIPGSKESERFETEFCILLRKQLSQRNEKIKSVGVIGAVAAIDQLAKRAGAGVKLQELIELVWKIIENDGYSSWIFFDEMSDVVNEKDLPEAVQLSLKTTLGEKFKERWTVEEVNVSSRRVGDHGLKMRPVMNANEKMTEVDGLCIAFDSIPTGLSPAALPAHTKFLCTLESKISNGDLQEVDLIIGCPLLLPEFDYFAGLWMSTLTVEKKNALGRYLLVAINFVRELISAFYQQRDAASRVKIFLRMEHLITLQKMFVSFVSSWDNPCPALPFAYALEKNQGALGFVQAAKKKRKTKEKEKEKKATKVVPPIPVFDDSSDSDTGSVASKNSLPRKIKAKPAAATDTKDYVDEVQPSGIRPFIRNFSPVVFRLLKYPLVINPPDIDYIALIESMQPEQASYRNEVKQVSILSPESLVLLLRDLNQQIEAEKNDPSVNSRTVCEAFSNDVFKWLCGHLDLLQTSCVAEFSSWTLSKKRQVESCFRLVYSTMRNYLDVDSKPANLERFASAVKIITEHAGSSRSQIPTEESIAQYLGGYPDFINSPQTAAEQLKLMKIVYDLSDDKREIAKKIDEVAKEYLQRRWKIPSSVLPVILNIWFTSTEHPISVILSLAKSIIPEDPAKNIPDTEEFKACTATNFQTWYRSITEALCQHASKRMKKVDDVELAFAEWNEAIEILKLLVSVIQQKRQPKIITPLLRNVRLFLEAFSNNGIKLLPFLWGTDPNQARTFLRHLQNPTRKIQYICEHCKLEKYTLLIRYVPTVKRALETLIFKVREVLTLHGAPNAFWMGSLKHRNLDGEEINSQIMELSESEEAEDSDDEETSVNNENLFDMPPDEPSDQED